MRNDPPAGSVQTWTRPAYTHRQDRDYVPPPIFTQVRAPVALPRAGIKDQTAHRRGLDIPPAIIVAPTAPAPRPAPSDARPPAPAGSADAAVYAILSALPPGEGIIMSEIRRRCLFQLSPDAARHAAGRLERQGRIEQRALISAGNVRGNRAQWRIVQPGVPWGAIPRGLCLPGQRPRRTPQGRGLA